VKYLIDTHILIWWLEGGTKLSINQQAAINTVSPLAPLLVADITLWEIATLVDLGRLRFSLPLKEWLQRAVAPPLVSLCSITPAVAAQVASLPSSFHRDPGDRIITSTAIIHGAELITSDGKIIASGIVKTIS
jgi:PIN domain nuclease of toxin-antitoxin system